MSKKKQYQCASCGREVLGRSLCRDCERYYHHVLREASARPHGVQSMERMK